MPGINLIFIFDSKEYRNIEIEDSMEKVMEIVNLIRDEMTEKNTFSIINDKTGQGIIGRTDKLEAIIINKF